jgi:hypothetical protein
MARKLDPKSKAGFVRSQPASMNAPDLVKAAKAKGIKLDVQYVYAVRGAKKKRSKAARTAAKKAPVVVASSGNGSTGAGSRSAGGLEAQIERIVERKVAELLKARLGALFG